MKRLIILVIAITVVVRCLIPAAEAPSPPATITAARARSIASEIQEAIDELHDFDEWKTAKEIERLERERDAWLEIAQCAER